MMSIPRSGLIATAVIVSRLRFSNARIFPIIGISVLAASAVRTLKPLSRSQVTEPDATSCAETPLTAAPTRSGGMQNARNHIASPGTCVFVLVLLAILKAQSS